MQAMLYAGIMPWKACYAVKHARRLREWGCTVDDELWNELGEEVPAEWDDDQPARKRTGKPVPPGDYFTVIKGLSVCMNVSSEMSIQQCCHLLARRYCRQKVSWCCAAWLTWLAVLDTPLQPTVSQI